MSTIPCGQGVHGPDLVHLSEPVPELEDKLHLLIHRDVLREPAVRSATDALATVFKRHRATLLGEKTNKAKAKAA